MTTISHREMRAVQRRQFRSLGDELRQLREDAGRSQHAVAAAAGLSQGYVSKVEAGLARPSLAVLRRLSASLGVDLSLRLFPNTGPRVRDRLQLPMEQALLDLTRTRYRPQPEVRVWRPVRGVIDLVLHDMTSPVSVATEVHSLLRRAEQQIRWANEKADALAALPECQGRTVCRLLLLRNTSANRALVRAAPDLFAAAYPGRAADAHSALSQLGPHCPTAAILWVNLEGGVARVLESPPRGVRAGR
jgi:transcriptional regulator with XRE-family HTH domain